LLIPNKEEPEITRSKKSEKFVSLETALSKDDWLQMSVKKLKKVSCVLWGVLSKCLIAQSHTLLITDALINESYYS
jgi:hypothetical protein